MTRDVDPAGADTAALLQRTGLALAGGRVVFGFGGNDGDCATYRGRVVAVPETGGQPAMFTVDGKAGDSQGAIWMGGGAPAVDASGDVWVSAGNGSVYNAARGYDDSDSVLELSPSMQLLQYFAPSDWPVNNSHDLDMSTEPVLLPDGRVLIAGKSRIVYLLNGAHLGGIGGQLARLGPACTEDIDGGDAVTGDTVYLPCLAGSSRSARRRRRRACGCCGGPGPAAGRRSWPGGWSGRSARTAPCTASTRRTGQVRQQAAIGNLANHFPTPAVGAGLLLAPTADRVVAFRVTGAPGAPTSANATATPAPASPAPSGPRRAASLPRRACPAAPCGHRGRRPGGAGRDRLAALARRRGPPRTAWRARPALRRGPGGGPRGRRPLPRAGPPRGPDGRTAGRSARSPRRPRGRPAGPAGCARCAAGPADQQPGPPSQQGHAQRQQGDDHHEDHDRVGNAEGIRCGRGARPRIDHADPGRHGSPPGPPSPLRRSSATPPASSDRCFQCKARAKSGAACRGRLQAQPGRVDRNPERLRRPARRRGQRVPAAVSQAEASRCGPCRSQARSSPVPGWSPAPARRRAGWAGGIRARRGRAASPARPARPPRRPSGRRC